MYINHLTLSTGHLSRIERGDVAGETLARVAPWLAAAVEVGKAVPLPVSELVDYTALACVLEGSLIITVSGPNHELGPAPPLVTLGVAKRSRHGAALWPLLTGPVMPPTKAGLVRPAEPWCAVAIWPTISLSPDALRWLADFEKCVAWAWVTRPEDEQ